MILLEVIHSRSILFLSRPVSLISPGCDLAFEVYLSLPRLWFVLTLNPCIDFVLKVKY